MRTAFLSFLLLPAAAFAQCTFTPTVTPNDLILCPQEEGVLSTQEYDSYQWYKDGEAIDGATEQTLNVEQFADAGYMFSVEATLDGCTEMSEDVMVDGWMFLLPYVIHGGDEPNGIGIEGESFFCVGDTMTLTMGMPYTTNITWYRNGEVIDGENDVVLTITTSGSYTGSGAPETCPNYIAGVGVDVVTYFQEPSQPTIVQNGDQLCAEPEGESYQWYMNEEPIVGDAACIPAEGGSYTVYVDYGQDCQVISAPFLVTGVTEATASAFTIAPNPANGLTRITWPSDLKPSGAWRIADVSGRTVMTGSFNGAPSMHLDLSPLTDGNYVFQAMGAVPLRLVVKR